jgi:hypothetical protein
MTSATDSFIDISSSINKCTDAVVTEKLTHGVNLLKDYLSQNSQKVKLHTLSFNTSAQQIESVIIGVDNKAVYTPQNEVWSIGAKINYNINRVQVCPYFAWECGNFVVSHMSIQRYFNTKKYQQLSYSSLLEKIFSMDCQLLIEQKILQLQNNNISLREFYNAYSILASVPGDWMDMVRWNDHILQSYATCKIKTKNQRWMSTGNTNINALVFFKHMIKILNTENLTVPIQNHLNLFISELFFNGPDLINRAPDPFLK